MIYTLICQELLSLIMGARFFVAVLVTLVLVVANTVVLLDEHERRLTSYRQQETENHQKIQEATTYSMLELFVERPPNPLSLFSAGLDKRLGGAFEIHHAAVPVISEISARGSENPYLDLLSHIDLVFIFQVVLSLLALLFAYDAIAGDRETGVLRLVISHPVGRGSIIFAKYLAAMGCLLLPVLMSLLLVMILLTLTPTMQLSLADFLRIGGIVLTTIIYLSCFYMIGMLISTTTDRSTTSLMLCMFLWVVLVLVYPNWSRFAFNIVPDTDTEKASVDKQVTHIWEEADREERRFLANSPLTGQSPLFNLSYSSAKVHSGHSRFRVDIKLKDESEPLISHVQDFHKYLGSLQIRLAEKSALVREEKLRQIDIKQARWDERMMKLSPACLYMFATSAWTGTDLDGILDFVRAAQGYRQTLIDYYYDKQAFASRLWFASDQRTVDWWDLPQFNFQRVGVRVNAQRALSGVGILGLTNLMLFITTFWRFAKIEI